MQSVLLLSFLYLVYIQIKRYRSSKTTYSFILKKQMLTIIVPMMVLLKGNYFSADGILDGLQVGLTVCSFYQVYITRLLNKKHTNIVLKYKNA